MKVVIINGVAGSGKDTFVRFCRQLMGEAAVMELSTVSTVKSAMMVMGWDGEKSDAARRMMSDIKDAWSRYNDGPFSYVVDAVSQWSSSAIAAVFVHVREPEEIEKLERYFGQGCITVLVCRDGIPVPDNHADQGVAHFPYQVTIYNDGDLASLRRQAHQFCAICLMAESVGEPERKGA